MFNKKVYTVIMFFLSIPHHHHRLLSTAIVLQCDAHVRELNFLYAI